VVSTPCQHPSPASRRPFRVVHPPIDVDVDDARVIAIVPVVVVVPVVRSFVPPLGANPNPNRYDDE
jgi:hypothetical protein